MTKYFTYNKCITTINASNNSSPKLHKQNYFLEDKWISVPQEPQTKNYLIIDSSILFQQYQIRMPCKLSIESKL